METNKVTTVDIEAAMEDVYQPTVEAVKSSRSWSWTIVSAVALISLCAVAALCFAWHFPIKSQSEPLMAMQSSTSPDVSGQHEMLSQIAKSTKAAIHLRVSGQHDEKLKKNDRQHHSLQWVTGVDQSFTIGGLKLENNSILIPHDGLYFVYSQASFNIICKSAEEENDQNMHLTYRIRWTSPTSPSKTKRYLLSGIKSLCQTKSEKQMNSPLVYESIYLGAVFQLYKGDKLSTDITGPVTIDGKSSATFFGVFEL